jgi:arylsulfatase A-like enzyme
MTWSERGVCVERVERVVALLLISVLAGCGRAPEGFLLRPLVGTKTYSVGSDQADGLSFSRQPELADVEIDHERRPVVLASPGTWRWRGEIPEEGARLHAGVQLLPAAWAAVQDLSVELVASDGDLREVLDAARVPKQDEPRWIDLDADLSRWAGREVTLEMKAEIDGLPAGHGQDNVVAWGPVSVAAPPDPESPAGKPNILFILVDTLRRDHLTPYGYERLTHRDTTPEIQSRLALPGAVVEEAYSQAPWTLPSVVSFLTGRYPGELLSADMTSFGIPDEVPPLPELLARLGYQTGGFIGNPSLHAGAGFGRGFRTFFAPPADIEWMQKHADTVNAHAVPWLQAHQDRPFFAYVHYIDPHDPYQNPDMDRFGGRSPFMPDYTGPVAGNWIHGIYNGNLQLPDPERDIPYIRALYDGEVHYVDRHIGELLASLDPKVLANTLVVLTADHGEELYDHGGWKHGQTLYDEQIHVPLIFRWDGHIKPGTRLRGTVRLVDLVPTLIHAAGGKADPAWSGIDLLPALLGKTLPRRPAFAQHLTSGPLRAAAVLDRRKLILYNEREPFQPADPMQAHLYEVDAARFRRQELYDLSRDPGEKENLANDPAARPLSQIVHQRLAPFLPGTRVVTDGALQGARLSGTITFQRAPQRWVPYFLGPEDRVEMTGNRIAFALTAEPIDKGFRLEGDPGRVVAVTLSVDGRPVPPGRAVSAGNLKVWTPGKPAVARRAADPETEKRLRSLGYIQ